MAPRKRDTQVQEDGQTVYKPAKKTKTVVKEEPEDKKPVRLKPARTKTGRLKPEAEKEEKKPDKKPPRRYEPEQKLTGREKKEKARAAAVARDRRRAVSRAGDGCVTMIALLTAVFEVLGLLLCAAKAEGAWDTQAVRLCMVMAPLGLLTTLALPRLLPMDSLVMALTNFLCGVGVVVLYTVSPERGARQAMFYAMGLAAMLVMSEIVFHVRHFRGLTLLGMALGNSAAAANFVLTGIAAEEAVQLPPDQARRKMASSYFSRMLMLALVLAAGLIISWFDPISVVFPLFFVKISLTVGYIFLGKGGNKN